MEIAYEKHPVSKERKAQLRADGFKIIDARFKPAETTNGVPSKSDIATMKKGDVKEWLEAHGADTGGSLPELKDRLRSVMFVDE